jgi:L-lactate utilization protein LutB
MAELIQKTLKALKQRKMNGYYISSKEELFCILNQLIPERSNVGCGDSVTLEQLEVLEYLRRENIIFYDKYAKHLTHEDKREIYLKNFSADVFVTGSNAITADGEIINIDGNGSRVAPMIYGPKKVVIVVGENKITENLEQGMHRARQLAAPLDAKRLGKNTPCTKIGKCVDCKAEQRICNDFVTISGQFDSDRIHVIIVKGSFGY